MKESHTADDYLRTEYIGRNKNIFAGQKSGGRKKEKDCSDSPKKVCGRNTMASEQCTTSSITMAPAAGLGLQRMVMVQTGTSDDIDDRHIREN